MAEVLGSKEQPNIDKYDLTIFEETDRQDIAATIGYVEKWLQLSIEEKFTDDAVSLICEYSKVLIDALKANEESGLKLLKQQSQEQHGLYVKVRNIAYPDLKPLTELPYSEFELPQLERLALKNVPVLCEASIEEIIDEFEILLAMLNKNYDFTILGDDLKRFLRNAAMQIESLSELPESEISIENYGALFNHTSGILQELINRRQLIHLNRDEMNVFVSGMISAEEPITEDILQERYAELVALAEKILNKLKVTQEELATREAELAENDEFQDMPIGSGIGKIVETVGSSLKEALAIIPKLGKSKDPSQDK